VAAVDSRCVPHDSKTCRPLWTRFSVAFAAAAILLLAQASFAGAAGTHVYRAKAVKGDVAVFVVNGVAPKTVVSARVATPQASRQLPVGAVRRAVQRGAVQVKMQKSVDVSGLARRAVRSGGGGKGSQARLVIATRERVQHSKHRQPSPEPTPEPAPEPAPEPTPAPAPAPAPEPAPAPAPEPAPAPAPAPEPTPFCSLSSFAEGEVPGACWRPFGSASPFNQPLPASPRLMSNSKAIVEKMFSLSGGRGPAEIEAYNDGRGGEPTYYSKSTDPQFTIHCTKSWGRCMVEGMKVRIPAGARTEGNVASTGNDNQDAHLTVVDRSSGREYDFWQVQTNPLPASGGNLNISWGGYTDINGTGLNMTTEATAAKWASLEGRVRAEELLAGKINHALFIVVKCDSGNWVYPAAKAGSRCSDTTNAPPLGARLQLNYSDAEIEALSVPAWKKTLLRAMADYGMIIGDTGTDNLFWIERETGSQYTTQGKANKWLELVARGGFSFWNGEGGVNVGDVSSGVDWHRLRVVDPCVSQGTC
jgi:outer membrane biosynthesis protein TonB